MENLLIQPENYNDRSLVSQTSIWTLKVKNEDLFFYIITHSITLIIFAEILAPS